MQAGSVGQLAAVVMDVERQALVTTPRPEYGPDPAGPPPAAADAPQHERFAPRDGTGRPARRLAVSDTPKGAGRPEGGKMPRKTMRCLRTGRRGKDNAAVRHGPQPTPAGRSTTWTQAVKAAIRKGAAPTHAGPADGDVAAPAAVAEKPPAATGAVATSAPVAARRAVPLGATPLVAARALVAGPAAKKVVVPARGRVRAVPTAVAQTPSAESRAPRRLARVPHATPKAAAAAPERAATGTPQQAAAGAGKATPTPKQVPAAGGEGKIVRTLVSPVVSAPAKAAAVPEGPAQPVGAPGKGDEPRGTAGAVAGPAAPDAARLKAGKALDAAVADAVLPPAPMKATQAAGRSAGAAVHDGPPASVRSAAATALVSKDPPQPQARASAVTDAVVQTLRSAARRGEFAVAAAAVKGDGEGRRRPRAARPSARRAVEAFQGAVAGKPRGAGTARSKAAAATRAFAVERTGGGRTVVSHSNGAAPAGVVSGVTATDATFQRTGAGPGRVSSGALPQGLANGDVADQVAESIRTSGAATGRQIVVQLQPPDLGRVRIVFRSEGDAVRGVVRVDSPETLSRLEREAAPLMQRLASSGVEVRRLDVMLSDSQGDDVAQNPAFREGQDRPNGWVGGEASGSPSGDTFGDAGPPAAEAGTVDPGAGIGNGAINVRI